MKPHRAGRYLRLVRVTSARWQRWAIFLVGGVIVGAAAARHGCADQARA
jgi:hypothetical protein